MKRRAKQHVKLSLPSVFYDKKLLAKSGECSTLTSALNQAHTQLKQACVVSTRLQFKA